jgi:1-acyl-sn-glycerol-3-phosphate acyltransferase
MTRRLRRGAIFARAIHKSFREFNRRQKATQRAPDLAERAEWLTQSCRGVLASLGLTVAVDGSMPSHGLIVSNHLSYLDILCFSSLGPCVFVSKSDVRGWPVFGRMATNGGTIYIDRTSRVDAGRVAKEIEEALRLGVRVVLFPEGTSSGGDTVLPFHAPLFEAAVRAGAPITPAYISYTIEGGDPKVDVCYWGGMTFATHFLGLLGKGKVHASISFGRSREGLRDRKIAARTLHADVVRLQRELGGAEDKHGVQAPEGKRVRQGILH